MIVIFSESATVELKQQYTDTIIKSMIAFANTRFLEVRS
jgi:hypothetical protein